MDTRVYIVVAGLLLLLLLSMAKRPAKTSKSGDDYQQLDTLFTAAERSFLGVLDKAAADRYRVFGKVRVADVLQPAKGVDKRTWSSLFNRIKAKHFDFVLCDPKTLSVRAVIELNDKSHDTSKRSGRDSFLREACANAGLELLEVPAQRSYSSEAVRQVLAKLERRTLGPSIGGSVPRIEPHF
jgi:hypothetical protein